MLESADRRVEFGFSARPAFSVVALRKSFEL